MTTSSGSRVAPHRFGSPLLAGSGMRAVAAACWVYAGVMAVTVKFLAWQPATLNVLTDYVGVPVTAAALLLVCMLLLGASRITAAERRAWGVIGIFAAVNIVANQSWIGSPRPGVRTLLSGEDALYLTDYGILTLAFGLFFVSLGGSWRRPLVWLDVATMMLVQLIGFWTLLVAPQMPAGVDRHASLAVIVAYSLSFAAMTSSATVLWMQTRSRPGQDAMLLLIAAAWCEVAWEVMWLANWLADADYAAYYYNFGDVLCFCCVASAAAMTQARIARAPSAIHPERSVESYLPALAALLAIAMVAASTAATHRAESWSLVGLVVLCAALVLARQRSVRRERQAMLTALAQREADARLTELVRRSTDLIVVIDAAGGTGFVSPAAVSMLGIAPEALLGARGADLLGPSHAPRMQILLDGLKDGAPTTGPIELCYVRPDGAARIIKVTGINQLANTVISGLVLTLTDVSDQRALEREVLNVATRERARFCADIHDGLGQELVGIAMLLQGEAAMPDPDPAVHQSHLKAIVGHVNRSIQITRDLARGLSPLHVVRGSLSGALYRLAHESGPRRPVNLAIAAGVDDVRLDDVAADHLYRIAQEAVLNAISHSGCTHVDVSLSLEDSHLVMRIDDDGHGFDAGAAEDHRGLGLKLMEYRARLVGGVFRLETLPHSGTRIQVTISTRTQVPPVAADPAIHRQRGTAAGGS